MNDQSRKDMIDEIKDNIKNGDMIKARLVLSHFDEIGNNNQNRILFEISRAEPDFKVPLLGFLIAKSEQGSQENLPMVREMLISNLLESPDLLLTLLKNDINFDEKLIFIHMAGEIRNEKTIPLLLKLLDQTGDDQMLVLLIEAIGKIGDPVATSPLTEYLYSGKKELIIASIEALGRICSPTAIHRLAERMGTDTELDHMILEIFLKVQDATSLEILNNTIQSHHAQLRNYAKKAFVQIGAKAVPILTENLLHDDPDLLIHSLNVLGEIGDPSAIVPIRKLLTSGPKDPNIRFAAYESLSRLPLKNGAYILAGGLTDPVEHVCIAAAKAIDRNFNDLLHVGIKNLIKAKDKDSHQIVRTIINAMAETIFLNLAPEDYFQELILKQMPHAHEDVRKHYAKLLKKNGFKEFAGKIGEYSEKPTTKLCVCAVDDSRMILNIFKNTLHELGYESVLFEFPESAIQWFESNKPDILLTDLNMPDITGIELTKKIREKYNKKVLPIVMVTTQNDAQDNEAAYQAGVDDIIYKPFDSETLNQVIEKYIKPAP